MQEYKAIIENLVKIALSDKGRNDASGVGRQIPENLPQFFYEDHGVYIRVLKKGAVEREGGNIYTIMPLAKTIISTLENFEPFEKENDASGVNSLDVEVSIIKEVQPVIAKEQLTKNHGVFIQYGPYNAVLLPHEFDGEDRLNILCQKAKIHEDAWKERGAQLFMFEPETIVVTV